MRCIRLAANEKRTPVDFGGGGGGEEREKQPVDFGGGGEESREKQVVRWSMERDRWCLPDFFLFSSSTGDEMSSPS
jgi:hypothetical protein